MVGKPKNPAALPRSWVWVSLAVVALLLGARIWNDFAAGSTAAGDGTTLRDEATEDGVRVRAVLEGGRLEEGGEATLWVSIEHRGDGTLLAPRIAAVDAPGFIPSGPCWQGGCPGAGCVPACPVGTEMPETPPSALQSGQVVSRWARLQVDPDGTPARTITATASWEHQANPTAASSQHLAFVHLGPITVRQRQSPWAIVLGSLYTFSKDLGLPIALGLITYLFQILRRKREERHETWQSLLPRAHENAVKYVLPMCVVASQAAAQIRQRPKDEADEIALRRAFYYLVKLLRLNLDLLERGGGYFFSNRAGEDLVVAYWDEIFDRAVALLRYDRLSHLLDQTRGSDSLTRFEGRFEIPEWRFLSQPGTPRRDPIFTAALGDFKSWVDRGELEDRGAGKVTDLCTLLTVFSQVAFRELNLLYGLWYDEPETDDLEALQKTLKDLRWSASSGNLEKLAGKVRNYAKVKTSEGGPSNKSPSSKATEESDPGQEPS